MALPRMAWGSFRRLPVCGSGTLPWSFHHVAYSCSVLLLVSRSSPPSTCRLSPIGTKLSSRRCPDSVTHRSLGCCFSTQLPAPRAQFALRTFSPSFFFTDLFATFRLTRHLAHAHDACVLTALSALLLAEGPSPLPPAAPRVAQLALRHCGLGLRSAALHAPAAYWASWADAVAVLRVRNAPLVNSLVRALDNRSVLEWSPVQDLAQASDAFAEAKLTCPGIAPYRPGRCR